MEGGECARRPFGGRLPLFIKFNLVTAHGNHALDKAAGTEGSLRSRLLLFILFKATLHIRTPWHQGEQLLGMLAEVHGWQIGQAKVFVLVAHLLDTGAIRVMEFLGVGVQLKPGALGQRRGKRRVRRRLAARRPVLAGVCAEPAVLSIGVYGNLALLVRPIQGDAMLLQGGHGMLR